VAGFNNKTNGRPTPLALAKQPKLAQLITQKIGNNWIKQLDDLKQLETFADDAEFRNSWRQIKHDNKQNLAKYIRHHNGIEGSRFLTFRSSEFTSTSASS